MAGMAPRRTPKAPATPDRRLVHRDKLLEAGGRTLTVELSATAGAALEYIKRRDGLRTNREAIEDSLMLNAHTPRQGKPP